MVTTRQPGRTGRASDPNRAARLQRDAAFERVGSITKGIGVASVAAVAAFGIYVSRALPGHASTPAGSTAGTASGGSASGAYPSTGGSPSDGQSSNNLAPPYNPPVQTQQPAPVVSGSS